MVFCALKAVDCCYEIYFFLLEFNCFWKWEILRNNIPDNLPSYFEVHELMDLHYEVIAVVVFDI